MDFYNKLARKPKLFLYVTGMTLHTFKVEHTIGRRKKYRIASEEYRNRDRDYDQTMNIVAGLVNLRANERVIQTTGVKM